MALTDIVKEMSAEQREGALFALDACTRPLTVREVEMALRRSGLTSARATKVASSLRKIAIVAVAYEDGK